MTNQVTRIEWAFPITIPGTGMPKASATFKDGVGTGDWLGWSLTLSTNFVYLANVAREAWVNIPRDQCIIHGAGKPPVKGK